MVLGVFYIHAHINTYLRTYIHTYINTHTYLHIDIYFMDPSLSQNNTGM